MGILSRAVIAKPGQQAALHQDRLRALLEAADLVDGRELAGQAIARWELEGQHVRLELQPARDLAVLLRPLDDGAAFLRGPRWLVSYRGEDFAQDDAARLGLVLEHLELATDRLGLSLDDLREMFRRPEKDSYLEVSPGKKLYVRVTDHCDEKCVFCNATEGNANIVPSRQTLQAILRELPVGGLSQVIFSGGEPTLIKSLPAMVKLAYDRGARQIIVQTNGVAFGEPGALEPYLPFRDRLGIGFSLHAFDPALSAQMIDVADPSRFAAKIAAIDRAVELGFATKITCVVMRPNLAQVPDFARWAWRRWGKGLTVLQFSYAMPRGNAWLNQHLLAKFSECTEPFAEAFALGRETGLRVETSQTACMPPCTMPDHVAEHFDLYGDFAGTVSDPERVKPPETCTGCRWDRICAGVWKRYVDVFGTGELHAVTDRDLPPVHLDDYIEAEVLG
jgi:molybdenum cofactor biosynthesis enzyme MoaA